MTKNRLAPTDEKGKRVTDYQHSRRLPRRAIGHRGVAAGLRTERNTARATSTRTAGLVALAAALALLTAAPGVASAKQARLFSGSFGEATSTPANPYPLAVAGSVAVDSTTHDVYVADPQNFRVEKFDSSGLFLFMLGSEVNKTAVEESATRESEENVCPAVGHPADACQAGRPGAGSGAFLDPAYVAVDNSSGSSRGDLYVGNTGEVNEEQTITITATGGTFTLSFEGETTAPIPFNSNTGEGGPLKSALRAMPKTTGVDVVGSPGNYTLTFTRDGLSGRDVPQMACDGSALSGVGASCVVATKRQGFTAENVEKFDASGQLVTAWGEGGEFNAMGVTDPPSPVAGPFKHVYGIAVDVSGNLWVSAGKAGELLEENVFEFREDSNFISGWTGEVGALAVDAADSLYFLNGPIREFSSVGNEIGVVAPAATEVIEENFGVSGEAVDAATGSLYVAGGEGFEKAGTLRGIVKRYVLATCHPVITHEPPEPGCAPAESFGAGLIAPNNAHPLAIDSATDALYVADQGHVTAFSFQVVPDATTTKPTNPTSSAATLTAVVNPGGVELNAGTEGCRFEWGETTAPYEHTAPCDKTAAQIGKGDVPVEVQALISGLQAGKTYHYRLVASNANDVNASITEPSLGADVTFGPPRLESASALDVSATSAVLQAQVNPNDLDTHVRVEYGTEAGVYSQSTPALDIGSDGTVQSTVLDLSGLAPGVVYHYRAVVENVLGEGPEAVHGPDQTFTTQTASTFALPDHRGWELVSPTTKHGAIIEGPSGFTVVQAAADGNAMSYTSSSPTEPGAAGNAAEVQILSARTAAGWSSRDLATPNVAARGGSQPAEYMDFSSDLSLGIVEPQGELAPEMSVEASEQTPFLRTDFPAGEPANVCTGVCYRPLVTGKPGFANVPPGTEFGRHGKGKLPNGVNFRGASPDGRSIVVQSDAALVEGASGGSLYEWTEGHLQLISLLPGEGGPAEFAELGRRGYQRNAVSTDGSRVVWSENIGSSGSKKHLYLRDVPAEETVQLDLNQGGTGQGPVTPLFQDASSDGSVVFFTDGQQLTAGAGASTAHPDLYRCQVVTGEFGEECRLTDLTPANGAEIADVQGGMIGASDDGSSAYFVANGVLAHNQVDHGAGPEEAIPGSCGNQVREEEQTATCNLYLSRGGEIVFIARLSFADGQDFGAAGPSRVSSNGQWLALMSERSLTGYDNRDRSSGKPVAEVYLYNSLESPAGALRCVSCDPSGSRPHGVEYLQLEIPRGDNNIGSWDSRRLVAAFMSGGIDGLQQGAVSVYRSRTLSDSGRLFFNAIDGLVPQDSNGTEDVYQYEPSGAGGCTESAATFGTGPHGCVDLISSGTSGQESVFMDASESGDDVFFVTTSKLSPLDVDTAYDVYDARVAGGDRERVKPIECQGDACQGFVEPPSDATPGSLVFSGPGNLKPLAPAPPPVSKKLKKKRCPNGKKLKHKKCVKARKGKRRAGRSNNARRAK